jgi:hypothetical protein
MMRKIAGFFCLMLLLSTLVACAADSSAPADYYENDLHHGYPGPATADPSAI